MPIDGKARVGHFVTEIAYIGRMRDLLGRITIHTEQCHGQPCIRGMRITVSDVLEYLAAGMSTEEILNDFPDLTADDIRACLSFAAERERRILTIPAA